MELRNWSKSEFEYGRKILNSGLEGARSGREAFLNGRPLTPFLGEVSSQCLEACRRWSVHWRVGRLSQNRHRSVSRALAYGFVGLGNRIRRRLSLGKAVA